MGQDAGRESRALQSEGTLRCPWTENWMVGLPDVWSTAPVAVEGPQSCTVGACMSNRLHAAVSLFRVILFSKARG